MTRVKRRLCLVVAALIVLAFTSSACQKLNREITYTRARSLHDKGRHDEAIELYKKLIENSKDNSEVQYDLGVAYADKKDMVMARKQAEILRKSGRTDLAQVLEGVIKAGDASRVRKRLQKEYDDAQADKK